LAWNALLLKLD